MGSLRRGMMAGGGGGDIPSGDPYWANVVALLRFEGDDESTTFDDETGRIWTPGGDAKISTTNPKFGAGCGLFDGNGDYLTTASSDGFAFGTGDYCIEAWVNIAGDTGQNQFIFNWGGNWGVYVSPSPGRFFLWNGSSNAIGPVGGFNFGEYFHVAHSREDGVMRLHVNGTQIGSTTNNTNFGASAFYLSFLPSLSRWVNGRYDEVRITKGVSRYTSGNFTPPSGPFPGG